MQLEFADEHFLGDISLQRIPAFIERGLNVEQQANDGKTVLHTLAIYLKKYLGYRKGAYAIYSSNKTANKITDIINLIKSKAPSITKVKDSSGLTALDYALTDAKGYEKRVKKENITKLLDALK